MASPIVDTDFSTGTTITSNWLNGVNDAINDATQDITGATPRTVVSKLADTVSVKDFGAVGDGVTDDTAAFTNAYASITTGQIDVPSGTYNLATAPSVDSKDITWTIQRGASFTGAGAIAFATQGWANRVLSSGSYESLSSDPAFYNGLYGYLEQNATLTGYGVVGLLGSVKASGAGSTGATTQANIALSGVAINDYVGGSNGVWGNYLTVCRQPTSTGYTHGMEIDVANMGTTAPCYPASMFPNGLTSAAWLASGGEPGNPLSGVHPGVASCAIGIIANDPKPVKTALFEKGIVFQNEAIYGTDGATGSGIAIAFATGHQMIWFNNSNQVCAEITASGRTFANTNTRLDFSDYGLLYESRVSGKPLFAIGNSSTSVNYLAVVPANTGNSPRFEVFGDDANIDLALQPKGTGTIDFKNAQTPSGAGGTAGYLLVKVNGSQRKIPLYNV